ncbi:MAG: AAA family ATPase [Actinobacteria bacterium]|nr:AAA family ATPase [Actinomycetota bacterium]
MQATPAPWRRRRPAPRPGTAGARRRTSGKAADVLPRQAGCPAVTLDNLLTDTRLHPPPGATVILDEAGMASTEDLVRLVALAQTRWSGFASQRGEGPGLKSAAAPLTRAFVGERVTGIEPAFSAWEAFFRVLGRAAMDKKPWSGRSPDLCARPRMEVDGG